jgi:hypothetical protein
MTARPSPEEFAELRRKRDEGIAEMVREMVAKMGGNPDEASAHVYYGGGTHGCYCDCAGHGPCEHEFTGWRDIEDDDGNVCGGEQFCSRCGMGSMQHSMAFLP